MIKITDRLSNLRLVKNIPRLPKWYIFDNVHVIIYHAIVVFV